jgi:hypothetical protein
LPFAVTGIHPAAAALLVGHDRAVQAAVVGRDGHEQPLAVRDALADALADIRLDDAHREHGAGRDRRHEALRPCALVRRVLVPLSQPLTLRSHAS